MVYAESNGHVTDDVTKPYDVIMFEMLPHRQFYPSSVSDFKVNFELISN